MHCLSACGCVNGDIVGCVKVNGDIVGCVNGDIVGCVNGDIVFVKMFIKLAEYYSKQIS